MKKYSPIFIFLIFCCSCKNNSSGDDKYFDLAIPYKGVCKVGTKGGDGTLIQPQWILTAGHVAEGMFQRYGESMYVYFGKDSIKVKNVFLHPGYKPMGDIDIALLQLEEKITSIPYYPLYDQKNELNQKIVVVGHGDKRKTDGTWLRDGNKRAFSNSIDEVNEHYLLFNYSAPNENPTDFEWTCGPGDSGGPAFIKLGDTSYVAGVSSKGEPGKEGKASYGSKEFFVRVSQYVPWLNETIKNQDPEKALKNIKIDSAANNSQQFTIEIITRAFEDFSTEKMADAINQVYAPQILEKRKPEQIMSNMPVMMQELSNSKYQGIVSSNSEKVILKMQKGARTYHLELFFSTAEPDKIEQMAFGALH